jgi:two-component SAPR family response regulator
MQQGATLAGRRILVVEDEFLVAEYLSEILRAAGAEVLGPLGWVEETLAFVEAEKDRLDAVVLDVNLHGQPSFPIADALVRHGVRFVFTTGYDGGAMDAAYRGFPRCEKPFREDALFAALSPATA